MTARQAVFLRVAALALLAAGCATGPRGPAATMPPAPTVPPGEYVVQPGDTLAVRFYYHPDHDQDGVVVRPDGRIALPVIGEVEAAGLTPARLAERIAEMSASILRDPQVAVQLKAASRAGIYVGGEVNRPGLVEFRPGLTAVQAILLAGGPKDTARVTDVVLLQREDAGYRASKVDLAKVLEGADPAADPPVGAADVLFVPKTRIARLNVFVEQYILRMLPFRPGFGASVPVP